MEKYDILRKKIKGPVYPIPPAFKQDHSLDLESIGNYVQFLNSHNVRTLLTTAGTSRFNLLTNKEIMLLNEKIVDENQGKALTIVANQIIGSTKKAIEFARHAENIGADGILIYYPERYYNDDDIFNYIKEIANSADIGILLHGIPMRTAATGSTPNTQFSLKLCKRLSKLDNFIGMKEETGSEDLRHKYAVHLKKKMPLIVAGGSMRKFLSCTLYGVNSYLVGIGSFYPQIEEKFYQAVLNKNFNRANKIVTEFEEPFFNTAFSIGWHIAMKAAMSLLDIMPITERPPLQPVNREQLNEIKKILLKLKIL